MTTKEFNLSEKIFGVGDWEESPDGYFQARDVKEFIKMLKEKIKHMSVDDSMDYYDNCNYADFEEEINKLAGEKLI